MRLLLFVSFAMLAAPAAIAQSPLGSTSPADGAFERAAALVRDGHGDAGRQVVDSIFVRTRTGTMEHADALYWRAALAMDTQQAEGDYRRLVVEYPLSRRVDRALLALAQLEFARNDRERALAHLQRLEREHPAGEVRPTAAFWMARIRFDMNDAPRACASLDDAQRLARPEDAELRNQVEFYLSRCLGVDRAAVASTPQAAPQAAPQRQAAANQPSANPPANRQPAATQPPASRQPATQPPASRQPATPPPANRQPAAPAAQGPGSSFAVQVAAYDTAAEAEALVRRLAARTVVARVSGTSKPFRVRTGNFASHAAATAALNELRTRGIHGFVVDESAPTP
ncbi:MAG: tetratricopeptide repeat protein [Gemmatimonadaceae bacterium]|nr:tetratricopeptide repeat protein [Gemmatimonadaceae bacterium]